MKNTRWPTLEVSAGHHNALNSLNFVGFIPKETGIMADPWRILTKSTERVEKDQPEHTTEGNNLKIQASPWVKAPGGQRCKPLTEQPPPSLGPLDD